MQGSYPIYRGSGQQPKILVVEDDVDIRQILSVFLKHSGFDVQIVSDGQEAIRAIPQYRPDLIVLDLIMQPVSGWDVLRWLRAIQRESPAEIATMTEADTAEAPLHAIPVLILTALTHIDQQVDGFEAGAVEYMTKPTQPGKIVERINVILSLSAEERTMLRNKRIDEHRAVLERIHAPQPDDFFY
jgi:DNA-binding response OmpR family regulator